MDSQSQQLESRANELLPSVVLVAVLYVTAQMLADIGSLQIVFLAGLSIDAGTFIYPLTFTLRDMVHKVAGIKIARMLILAAAGVNIFMALFFKFIALLPPDLEVGPQTEFGALLSPVWLIVLASIVAEGVAELRYARGLSPTYETTRTRIPVDEPHMTLLYHDRQSFLSEHAALLPSAITDGEGMALAVAFPIFAHEEPIGHFGIFRAEARDITEGEKALLKIIGQEVGSIVARLQAEEGVQEHAHRTVILNDIIRVLNEATVPAASRTNKAIRHDAFSRHPS